jgi:hypothetical protein
MKRLLLYGVAGLVLAGCSTEQAGSGGETEGTTDSGGGARFVIESKKGSSCLQMPDEGEGKVRFKNVGDEAADFEQSVHPSGTASRRRAMAAGWTRR